MPQQYEQDTFAGAGIIETTTKKPIDKEGIMELLKSHHIETAAVENQETPMEDIVPSLRKAKVDLPEDFFKDLASKIELSFLDYSKVKKTYQEEKKSKLITVLPYPIISKYKIIPLEVRFRDRSSGRQPLRRQSHGYNAIFVCRLEN